MKHLLAHLLPASLLLTGTLIGGLLLIQVQFGPRATTSLILQHNLSSRSAHVAVAPVAPGSPQGATHLPPMLER